MKKVLLIVAALLLAAPVYASTVTLAWDAPAVQACPLIGYNIFRSATSGVYDQPFNGATPIAASQTTFIDTTVTATGVYYYTVRAECATVESAPSNEVKVDMSAIKPPPAPTNLNSFCLAAGLTLYLGWDAVPGVASYSVSWFDKATPTVITTSATAVPSLAFPYTAGHTYHWSVNANGGVASMDVTCFALQPPANMRISQ